MQLDAFSNFCRAHGLVVGSITPGKWVRTATTDHPKKKNGAYRFMGEVGFVQNHATMVDVAVWKPDAEAKTDPMQAQRLQAALERERQRLLQGWKAAAERATALLAQARQADHPYMAIKGLGDERGLVLNAGHATDEALLVPMRHWRTNRIVGAQLVRWVPDHTDDDGVWQAGRYEKKMLPGMRARGAVLRLGSPTAPRTWLVEGYATGLSVLAALRLMQLRDAVLVCFSGGNLGYVSEQLRASGLASDASLMVFADHDASGAGERTAKATGLSYVMCPKVGDDANDFHQREGVFALAQLMRGAMRSP